MQKGRSHSHKKLGPAKRAHMSAAVLRRRDMRDQERNESTGPTTKASRYEHGR